MGKLSRQRSRKGAVSKNDLSRLRGERRKLLTRLATLERTIAELSPRNGQSKAPTVAEIDAWFHELSAGFPEVPPLPVDFSRGDLYDDHD